MSPQNMPMHDMPMHMDAQDSTKTNASPTPALTSGQAPAPSPQSTAAVGAQSSGDSTAGRSVFRKCQACHSIEPGKNMLGPSLAGVIGRKAGSELGYSYSPAMKGATITWDATTLDQYLTDPAKLVPGNKMPFPGTQDRP